MALYDLFSSVGIEEKRQYDIILLSALYIALSIRLYHREKEKLGVLQPL